MVYLIQNIHSNPTLYQTAIAGGVAGSITRALTQPLDVLKIRFQLQLEPIKEGSKYSSLLQAFYSIIKEEKIYTLWSGHVPAQVLSITFGILQFSSFEGLTQLSETVDPEFFATYNNVVNFMNGSAAATFATIVSFPFDTIRTRLIAEQKTNKAYKGFFNAIHTMIRTEGARSLYKGLFPTLGQVAPNAGIQFAIYKLLTEHVLNRTQFFHRIDTVDTSTPMANIISGSFAGFVAKTVIYPFDLIKKRLQIQGFQHHRKAFGKQMYCNGVFHCVKLTIAMEGFLGLYKGFMASMLKAIVVSALHFAVYDEVKLALMRIMAVR